MRSLWIEVHLQPAANDAEALVAFVRAALRCPDEPATRSDIVAPAELDMTTFTASSAERSHAAEWRIESASCSVNVQHSQSFFPGDVNEPPRYSAELTIDGIRRGGPTVKVRSQLGDSSMSIAVEAPPDECDRIFKLFTDAFATTKSFVHASSS